MKSGAGIDMDGYDGMNMNGYDDMNIRLMVVTGLETDLWNIRACNPQWYFWRYQVEAIQCQDW